MTRYAVAILLALTMPASAADPANLILPGCKVFLSATTPMEHLSAGRCMGRNVPVAVEIGRQASIASGH